MKNKKIIIIIILLLLLIIIGAGFYLYYSKVYLVKIYSIASCGNANNQPETRSCIYYINIDNEKLCNKVGGRWDEFPQAASIAEGKTGKICIVETTTNWQSEEQLQRDMLQDIQR